MSGAWQVWLVGDGEYEQWGIVAAFATEALALGYIAQHCPTGNVLEFDVWDRLPQSVTHYERHTVIGVAEADIQHWMGRGWTRPAPNEMADHRHWASNEAYVSEPASVRVTWWSARSGPVSVTVDGNDRDAVDALSMETCAAVRAGTLKPEQS